MTISALPTPPSRSDSPGDFATKADAFLGALPTFATEANALAVEVNDDAVAAAASASTATTQAGVATTQANNASTSASNAATSAQLAEDWATKTTGTVDGTEYSAKYYAQEASSLTESYQGALSADPALDKTGNPLTAGDWYLNTISGFLRVYNGTTWVQGVTAISGVSSINGETGDVVDFVKLSTTQTLTNKTLTDPKLTLGGTNGTAGQVPVSQGAGLPPVWNDLLAGSEIIRVARTSNTQLTSANRGNLIDITSGTFTQTFDACSTLGNGWFCYIRNGGTDDITLDPNASETIDGLTSYIMYPGEVRLIQCDGTALRSVVLNPFYRVFTASGTFTKPPGYSAFNGLLWGGGGSGAKFSSDAIGGGGGGCSEFVLPSSAFGSSETITIGSGGTAISAASTNGNPGGNSSIGSLLSAGGGRGGIQLVDGSSAVFGGAAYATGVASVNSVASGYLSGGSSNFSGAFAYPGAHGAKTNGVATPTSVFGGAGGAMSLAGTAGAGTAPGGGGGATRTGTSGAGARGELRIWGII